MTQTAANAVSVPNLDSIPIPDLHSCRACIPLQDAILANFETSSPLQKLYEAVGNSRECAEGQEVVPALLKLNRWYGRHGSLRVDDESMVLRSVAMLKWAESVFEGLEDKAQAVVFRGPFLRGDPTPKNVEVAILTPYEPEKRPIDFAFGEMTDTEKGVHKQYKVAGIPQELLGTPIEEPSFHSYYESPNFLDLKQFTREPFLALARSPQGYMHAFAFWGSVE